MHVAEMHVAETRCRALVDLATSTSGLYMLTNKTRGKRVSISCEAFYDGVELLSLAVHFTSWCSGLAVSGRGSGGVSSACLFACCVVGFLYTSGSHAIEAEAPSAPTAHVFIGCAR